MTDAVTPPMAEAPTNQAQTTAPQVQVLLTLVEGADFDAALATVRRQVYDPTPEVVVVGPGPDNLPEGVAVVPTLEKAIAGTRQGVDYLWLLHSDARPRPDALAALVAELERNEAALGGSKLLKAATPDELESVGSATDVFGEPYSGLDEGEIDLQQYDVVREVAFVGSASMLVRRDLAQGLKGLDKRLPPVAAGLDFSQRTRLAGGRVISIPSSEVYHQGRCGEGERSWKEQAGRLRAMLIGYSPLTLMWVVPYDLVVSMVDSLANLLMLRVKPLLDHLRSWLWNLLLLPSTILQRRRFRPVRSIGDEELFRFQARGSVRLRETGSELSSRLIGLFDEDQALVRESRRIRQSPGIWGALLAVVVAAVSLRSIVFTGMPNVGFSFPFEPATVSLQRWAGGWNDGGLGSASPVHPSVGITGAISWLWLGATGAARTLLTITFAVLAIAGMGRLGGTIGLRGPGRYLSGLVLVAGPGTAVLTGAGAWTAIGGAALLPWAVRTVFTHPSDRRGAMARVGWAFLLGILLTAFSPLLAVAPLVSALLWKLWGGERSSVLLALPALAGVVASLPFLLGDPGWLTDFDRRLGLSTTLVWPALVVVAALPLLLLEKPYRGLGAAGASVGLLGLIVVRLPLGGPGVEESALVMASFGAAMVVAAGLDVLAVEQRRLVAALAAAAMVFLSLGVLGNGRLGLPDGDVNRGLAFAETLADEHGPGRILLASTQRGDIPGEARAGPGFWYRLIDGGGMTHDEVWLPAPRGGDQQLHSTLDRIATGADMRPGHLLAPYAVDWVVLDGPTFRLDDVFEAQLDLIPTPLNTEARVFENSVSPPIADAGADAIWMRSGTGFVGDRGPGTVRLALNHHDGWQPEAAQEEWAVTVSAADGEARFEGDNTALLLALASPAGLVVSIVLIAVDRRRR